MGKRSRVKNRQAQPAAEGEVGPRQPCPCGSGRRYKVCHGDPSGPAPVFVSRPFEGLASECDLVALREFVPAATVGLELAAEYAVDRPVTLCTLLPGAAPAVVRDSGEVLLALHVLAQHGDPARDLGAVLARALRAEPGSVIGLDAAPAEDEPRIQDLLTDRVWEVEVHDTFDYWIPGEEADPAMAAALEQANTSILPTARLRSVEAAYWTSVGTKEHLRWAMPEPEDALLAALARLHARGADTIAPDSRLVGMFRAHGVLTPVWDLPVGTGAAALEETAAQFKADLDEALADSTPLTAEERSARAGLANRQVTLR